MAQYFKMLLEGIVADADQRIEQLLLLTKLPVEWNQAALERKTSKSTQAHLVLEQTRLRP